MSSGSPGSKGFITLVIASGAAVLIDALAHWRPVKTTEFLALLAFSVVASRCRVKLPGVTGSMSVNLPFILMAAAELNMAEALVVGCLSTLAQCLPSAGKSFNLVRTLFNFANMALAVGVTHLLYDSATLRAGIASSQLLLAIATAGFFLVNSAPVAIVISLTEGKNAARIWANMFQLSYPYYLASAGVAAAVVSLAGNITWQAPVAMLLLMLGLFHSYRRYFSAADQDGAAKPESKGILAAN
ncbi:MAG TPA: hypothetical protein VNW97_16705 [Candidatus Saccharimonadales bacterium]|nr:hypothetical protein [Candidatus Saccharimonadales bacterium]